MSNIGAPNSEPKPSRRIKSADDILADKSSVCFNPTVCGLRFVVY